MNLIKRFLSMGCLLGLLVTSVAGQEMPIPSPPSLNSKGYLLIDHKTGFVLAGNRADEVLEPASITKLMTAYVVFKELANGNIQLSDQVTISEKAWRTPGSRMFVEVGKQVPVELLLQGMIIQSGNDASVALAEHIAGSEQTFAAMMNQYAHSLGMIQSQYVNSTGLPDSEHYTTASDIARLAAAIIDEFPQYYQWYSQKSFKYNDIEQHNRNRLLWRDGSVDGLKTGYTENAGYCLVSSAKRGDMRLISVVLGAPNEKSRTDSSQALMNYGFRFFETYRLYEAGKQIESAKVWKGESDNASIGLKQDLYVTVPRGQYEKLNLSMDISTALVAPVTTEQTLGNMRVSMNGEVVAQAPLFALKPVPSGGLLRRMTDEVRLWFE
ncbi:MAG: D-alanyl-D-alanine carboxypeptidase family protein [Pseudomonadota bacterium]